MLGIGWPTDIYALGWIYNSKDQKCEPFPDFDIIEYYNFRQKEGANCFIEQHPDDKFFMISCRPQKKDGTEPEESTKTPSQPDKDQAVDMKRYKTNLLIVGKTFQACAAGRDRWIDIRAQTAPKPKK